MAFITNYIQNTAMGMLSTGITAAGGLAGNAVGSVGSMIESAGRSAGDSVEGVVRKGGDFINGYGDRMVSSTATQDGPVKKNAVKPPPAGAAKRPAVTNGYTKTALPSASSKVKGLTGPPAGAAKTATGVVGGTTKTAGGLVGGTTKTASGVVGGTTKTASGVVGGATKSLPTPYKDAYSPDPAKKVAGKEVRTPSAVGGATGKVTISAASKPKAPGGMPKAPVDGPNTNTGNMKASGAPKVPGPGVPKVPSTAEAKKLGGAVGGVGGTLGSAGKTTISAASKPKPALPKVL